MQTRHKRCLCGHANYPECTHCANCQSPLNGWACSSSIPSDLLGPDDCGWDWGDGDAWEVNLAVYTAALILEGWCQVGVGAAHGPH